MSIFDGNGIGSTSDRPKPKDGATLHVCTPKDCRLAKKFGHYYIVFADGSRTLPRFTEGAGVDALKQAYKDRRISYSDYWQIRRRIEGLTVNRLIDANQHPLDVAMTRRFLRDADPVQAVLDAFPESKVEAVFLAPGQEFLCTI